MRNEHNGNVADLLPGEEPLRDGSETRAQAQRPTVPYGDNPYFPVNQDASAGAEDDQGDDMGLSGESAQGNAQGQDAPEPTFNEEQDRAAGINVDDPVYRKAMTLLAKSAPAETDEEVDARAVAARKRLVEEQQAQQNDDEVPALELNWEGFQVNPVPQDDPLSGHEDTIARIVREHVEYAVASVNRQNKQFVEQTKLKQTRDYISNVIDEIGKVAGAPAKSKALDLLQEFAPLAKSAPQKWARFVVRELGIQVDGGQSPQGEPKAPAATPAGRQPQDGNKLHQQFRGRATPPSAPRSGASASRKPEFSGKSATKDAVAWAFDQAASGKL